MWVEGAVPPSKGAAGEIVSYPYLSEGENR